MASSDPIKEAFERIKEDIFAIKSEIFYLKEEIEQLKTANLTPTMPAQNLAYQPSVGNIPTETPTVPQEEGGLYAPNLGVSTGNRGVPTNKPTNQQTYQQSNNSLVNRVKPANLANSAAKPSFEDFQKLNEILESLDSLKKEVRHKFKRLTQQEMAVFSTLFNLEDQGVEEITYKIIAQQLGLSEASIRDYTNKLLIKGIPILKLRQNNKKITMAISPDLRKIANLQTIMRLREL